MSNTFHIYGPPGTGKTRYLANEASKLSQGVGGSTSVLICSLTRAAAKEIAGRGTYVNEDMIGTLHAHAFRALGQPEMVTKHIAEWNDHCGARHMMLSGGHDDDMVGNTDGDKTMAECVVLRSKMVPVEHWTNARCIAFNKKWEEWKGDHDYFDFTDLIDRAIKDVEKPPGNPTVMIGDEAQDWSKLEATLFRDHWGKHAQTVKMSGDEDQTIFSWRGADPHIFSGHEIPKENETILEQSYRVPSAIHAKAISWIRQIKNRKDVIYLPKVGEVGEVRRKDSYIYRDPPQMVREVLQHVKNNEEVMILGSCAYMLQAVIKELRLYGIPFHNPYRTTSHNWNPLNTSKDKVSTMDRLKAFLHPDNDKGTNPDIWSKEAMQMWFPLLKSRGLLHTGTQKVVESGDFTPPNEVWGWGSFFKDSGVVDNLLNIDKEWFLENIIPSKSKSVDYPLKIIENGLSECGPNVVVGTIHSVKGAEADHVYLFPDIAYQASLGDRDEIIRLMYVGMTRAKQSLTLCGGSSNLSVEW